MFAVVVASDKLFYWLFQHQPDRILPLLPDLPADARGYRFSAPVLKEREYRLDGLFLPPPERPELPALILEAQMAADAGFLWRLYAEPPGCCSRSPRSTTGGWWCSAPPASSTSAIQPHRPGTGAGVGPAAPE